MGRMTKQELQKRKAELKRMVHADIVRREVMQFRLEPENIERLYQIAVKKRKPVGTMIREWVTDRITTELSPAKAEVLSLNDIRQPLQEIKERITIFEAAAKKLARAQRR